MVPVQSRTSAPRTPPALVVVLVVAALYLGRQVLIPIALAGLLTFLLAPAVSWLERWRLPRALAVLVLVGGMGLVLGGVAWTLQSQAEEVAIKLPEYRANIRAKLDALRTTGEWPWARAGREIAQIGDDIARSTEAKPEEDVAAAASGSAGAGGGGGGGGEVMKVRVEQSPSSPWAQARALMGPVLTPLVTMGIVAVFTIFMLMKREDVRDRFIRLVGARSLHLTTQALDDAAQRVNRYLAMQLAANVAAGAAVGAGLYAVGVESAALWAILVALLRFIPFVGMWIAAALPVVLSVAQSPNWTEPLLVLGVFALVEFVVANFLEPLLFGSGTGLSAIAILVSAVFWGWLWGGVGLLLATPLTVCVAVIGRHVPHLEFLEVLLGSQPGLRPEARLYQRLLAGDVEEASGLVSEFAKAHPPAEVYDALVLPAIALAEEDRHRGDLDAELERSIGQAVQSIVEGLSKTFPPTGAAHGAKAAGGSGAAVLCVPAWDMADEMAARMLTHLLRHAGVPADELSGESLSGELVAEVVARRPAVVCVTAVPAGGVAPARALYRRLRATMPDLHIVVALWEAGPEGAARANEFEVVAADRVVTSMSEALNVVKALVGLESGAAAGGAALART